MIFTLLISGATTGLGLLCLRSAAARVAVDRALRRAVPGIEAFRAANRHTRRLPGAYCQTNDALLEVIIASREARRTMMARMMAHQVPEPGSIEYIPSLEYSVERVGVSFFENMRTCYVLKVRNLALGQIADRFDDRLEILRHAKHDLSGMEQQVVDLLDKIGVIDFAESVIELIPEVIRVCSASAADAVADGLSDTLHATSAICHVPGLITGARDALQELNFLMEDNISLGDAFTDGVVPSVARIIMTKVGMVLDTATGWLSLGFFTVVCTWLGKLMGEEMLQARLEEQIGIVKASLETMRERQREALRAIRGAVDCLIRAFREEVEACPDIGDEPVLVAFVAEMREAYEQGLARATAQTAHHVERAIKDLPRRSWLDRLLSIDRSYEVAEHYWDAQRSVDSHLLGVAHAFGMAAQTHAEDSVLFLKTGLIFENAETDAALGRLDEVLVNSAADYARSLTEWEERCIAIWKAGTAEIEVVTAREHAHTRAVVEREQAVVEVARQKIAILRRRLGQKASA